MKITVNGHLKEIPETRRLQDVIKSFCSDTQTIVAEVNGRIVKGPQWKETDLHEGDIIELVTFMGGGR